MVSPASEELPCSPAHTPATEFERDLLRGERPVRADRIRLAYDVLRLCRVAACVKVGRFDAAKWTTTRTNGLDIGRVIAYLARVLDDRFAPEFCALAWINALSDAVQTVQNRADNDEIDIAPCLRHILSVKIATSPTTASQDAAWQNFRDILRVLGPIFAGEVTRADLSA